jgi:peptidoglycan/xylan/chitin deacetylase (PgdA/CDA1 family)
MAGRAFAAIMLVAASATALMISDTELAPVAVAPVVHAGVPVALPDPNDRVVRRGVNEGIIPLGRTRIYLPILTYHYIRDLKKPYDQLSFNLSVTPANFTLQMQYLWSHGYHPVTFDDVRAYFGGQRPLPSKPVVITIDDGYRDLYTTAYPILQKFGFRAVAYIVSSFVDRPRYVTSAMILDLVQNGFEIADHTVDHADIARESVPVITYEVVESKQFLEKLIGSPVVDFAYPSGKFNLTDMQVLHDRGYSTATTEQDGTSRTWDTRYAWPRTRVGGGESLADFIKSLGPVEPFVIVAPTIA